MARHCFESFFYHKRQTTVFGDTDVVAVEIVQLCKIEPGRSPADGVQVEPGDRLLGRYDLLVAVAPPEAQKVIPQCLGQIAELAIGIDADCTLPLRHFSAIRAVN